MHSVGATCTDFFLLTAAHSSHINALPTFALESRNLGNWQPSEEIGKLVGRAQMRAES